MVIEQPAGTLRLVVHPGHIGEPDTEGPPQLNTTLEVAAGEIVAITGEHGSTVLWTFAGYQQTHAQVLVDGKPISTPDDALAAGVLLAPAGHGLALLLTAMENVLLPLADHSRHRRPVRAAKNAASAHSDRSAPAGAVVERARAALEAVGLRESADHLVEQLSGGQQQRVSLARAIASRPRLLLADQPTTDLDAANRDHVFALFKDLASQGSTILVATDNPTVADACDRSIS